MASWLRRWRTEPVLKAAGLFACGLAAAAPHGAWAVETHYGGEHYQQQLIDHARDANRLEIDPDPDGKLVERIVVVPYDVFVESDPYPMWGNWFHATTKQYVIERELLFGVGDRWSADEVAESARNIRGHFWVNVARIVACKGSSLDKVVALVVTKDTWSLRPNAEFQFVDSHFQYIQAEAAEENLFGLQKQGVIDLGLDPAVKYAGQQYRDHRLAGSQLSLAEKGDLIWNRTGGAFEGGVADISLERPLYTLDTPWGWTLNTQYRNDVYRLFSGSNVALYQAQSTGGFVPYEFKRHQLDLQAGAVRSFGHDIKRDYSFGYRAFVHKYGGPLVAVGVPVGLVDETLQEFESTVIPLSESAGMLYAGFHFYRGDYLRLLDMRSYAVTEDYRLGPDVSIEGRFASPAFGLSSSFFEPIASASWTTYASDDLFIATLKAQVRYQPALDPNSVWANGLVAASLYNATPRLSIFRLHTGVKAGRRYHDFNHDFNTLGGDNSLRGYPVSYLIGANYWNGNAEIRTEPLNVWTVHLGLAGFFDTGAAANDLSNLMPQSSVGGGFRIGFPQFNSEVLRVDFGVPLNQVVNGTPVYIVAQYGQAF